MRRAAYSLLAAGGMLAGQLGCAALHRPVAGEVLAARLADVMPHGDRDHFVFRSEKSLGDRKLETSLTVEHISASSTPGEFQVTESSDGVRVGDSLWLSSENGLALVSEDVEGLGLRLTYDPPLLVFPQPLLSGEHRAAATGAATRLSDGGAVGFFRASVMLHSGRARAVHPFVGAGGAVSLRVTRTLAGANGVLVIRVESVNAEGVGEIESVAALDGVPFVIRRSLVCGFIQGRAIGHCDALHE
jgi:hypothetical protein